MTGRSNKPVQPAGLENKDISTKEPKRKASAVSWIIKVLGGEFLAQSWIIRQMNYLLFLAAIAVVYIANNYYTEDIARNIDRINRSIKELHYEYIQSKSDVMHQSKQSELARKLQSVGLKESVDPVKKIIIPKNELP